jgi:hypothetical protein
MRSKVDCYKNLGPIWRRKKNKKKIRLYAKDWLTRIIRAIRLNCTSIEKTTGRKKKRSCIQFKFFKVKNFLIGMLNFMDKELSSNINVLLHILTVRFYFRIRKTLIFYIGYLNVTKFTYKSEKMSAWCFVFLWDFWSIWIDHVNFWIFGPEMKFYRQNTKNIVMLPNNFLPIKVNSLSENSVLSI